MSQLSVLLNSKRDTQFPLKILSPWLEFYNVIVQIKSSQQYIFEISTICFSVLLKMKFDVFLVLPNWLVSLYLYCSPFTAQQGFSNKVFLALYILIMVLFCRDAVFNHFISRVRNNLHVVLCMSPVGDAFRTRCRMFPSLVNCCTIDWFTEWPR